MAVPVFSVTGKVTVVTGASRGIGNALAVGFAEAGAPVVLVARTVSELEETAQRIRTKGGQALVVPADVTKRTQVEEMVQKARKWLGRIDVLINVAGGAGTRQLRPPLEISEEFWDELQDRNLKSVFLVNQAVARVMVAQRCGSIINVSSMSGTKPVAMESAAGAAKAGVNQMTRAFAVAWAPYNVRVNAIAPGLTLTARATNGLGPELVEKFSKDIPLGRAAKPEDHLGPAIFLASDASSFITGVIIPSDGGPQ
ncbi:MAG: SDR family NAD(P)-dependent oxidoreductase [Chloroflexi bacterium]|nr:SDR family NAD(P)-dependent oxidoreductase [Chloroflexota bacterium]